MKKCEKCEVPLEGFRYKISKLMGVKASETQAGVCNKCEAPAETAQTQESAQPEETTTQTD